LKLSIAQLKVLSAAIYHYFYKQDNPPADKIDVPVDAMRADRDEQDVYYATIRFIIDYCGRKTHSIRIKFNIDDKGRFLTDTWEYV
jgi:hypothetical protein